VNEGKKFRIYPTKEQIRTLSQWIGHQRFIYNAKVQEDRYFRKFKRKSLSLVGEEIPCDQKYSQFIGADTAFLKEVPSQILRNGAYRWMSGYQRFFKKLSDRPTIKKKHGRQSVMITKELFTFYSVDPQTAMIDLGTRKHPMGSVRVNEIVMKATDSGSIPEGEEVIAVAGTGYEADTVLILKSAASKRFLAYGFSKSSLSQGNNENATFQ
jgi:hypothetical protein